MEFGFASYGFGFLAGMLSTLSPCVLPLIPIILASALQAHPRAALALAAGLAISYALLGASLAWLGASLGFNTASLRTAGAVLLGLLGLWLLSSRLQQRLSGSLAAFSDAGNRLLERLRPDGLRGQFAVGAVLGVVWSPCVGPTLGAAIALASQGEALPQVILLMGIFGLGAALPIVLLAHVSRGALPQLRQRMLRVGQAGKTLMGGVMLIIAVLIVLGWDKAIEIWALDNLPEWITTLSTRY